MSTFVIVGLAFVIFGLVTRKKVKSFKPCRFTEEDRLTLSRYYPFFASLSDGDKDVFMDRLCAIMRTARIDVKDVKLSRKERIIIAAPWIILNWHLIPTEEEKYKRVYVVPKEYLNKFTGNYHHGEVNSFGDVILSLKNIHFSLSNPNDAIHLLFHEYAHALVLNRIADNQPDSERFAMGYKKLIVDHFHRFDQEYSKWLRAYAGTNDMEFFAVAIEALFEREELVKERAPELYRDLKLLLGYKL